MLDLSAGERPFSPELRGLQQVFSVLLALDCESSGIFRLDMARFPADSGAFMPLFCPAEDVDRRGSMPALRCERPGECTGRLRYCHNMARMVFALEQIDGSLPAAGSSALLTARTSSARSSSCKHSFL
jgi:hypothetical protein